MATEIEHKYLVDADLWKQETPERSFRIVQGYISRANGRTVRVRIKGENGYLTVKGPSVGASREEFEYRIPLNDAEDMLQLFCPSIIEKVRYEVTVDGLRWEVDEFSGANQGLILAEIELSSPDQSYEKPVWLLTEVTYDPRYSNASLSEKPYCTW
jgi:CYTH domain-containing protein